jgi:hypothetical protein
MVDSTDFPLPTSPAPPPYKSPSPDSEQAQVLQQLGHQSNRRMQFVYHASSLGMGMEHFTDLDGSGTGGSEGVNRPMARVQRALSPAGLGARSPRIRQKRGENRSQNTTSSVASQSTSAAGQAGGQTVSAAANSLASQTTSMARQTGSTVGPTASSVSSCSRNEYWS